MTRNELAGSSRVAIAAGRLAIIELSRDEESSPLMTVVRRTREKNSCSEPRCATHGYSFFVLDVSPHDAAIATPGPTNVSGYFLATRWAPYCPVVGLPNGARGRIVGAANPSLASLQPSSAAPHQPRRRAGFALNSDSNRAERLTNGGASCHTGYHPGKLEVVA
jgi:hypothetical protein